jgi:hypothetical protein
MAKRTDDAQGKEEIAPLEEEEEFDDLEDLEEGEGEGEGEGEEGDEGEGEEEEGEEGKAPQTVEDLQAALAATEEERDGYRRDLFRQRERNRTIRQRRQVQALYDQEAEGAGEADGEGEEGATDGDRIEVEMGDDGKLTIDRNDLMRGTRQATRTRGAPPHQRAVAEATMNYQRSRAQLIDEAKDPVAVADACEELELAYGYFDRMIGQAATELGVVPNGEESLKELVIGEGLDRRFARRFPNIKWDRLIHAPNDPFALRELVQGLTGKPKGDREDPAEEEAGRKQRALRTGDRPRTHRRGRRRARTRVTTKQFEELEPEELLRLSDEEVEEYDKRLRESR